MGEHQPTAFTTEQVQEDGLFVVLAWNCRGDLHRGYLPRSNLGVLSCDSLIRLVSLCELLSPSLPPSLSPSLPACLSANLSNPSPLPLAFQANSCVERAVLLQLQSYFQIRLAAYPTTIAEDDAVVSGRGLDKWERGWGMWQVADSVLRKAPGYFLLAYCIPIQS